MKKYICDDEIYIARVLTGLNYINSELDNIATIFTKKDNALGKEWDGNVFCNPPYGRELRKWLEKGYHEHLREPKRTIAFLIPARTDTSYWHDFIFGKADIQFLRGRLKFEINGEGGNPAPFPSAIVVYGKKASEEDDSKI